MTKFIITVFAVYAIYYLGNILYDLYFKKEVNIKSDDSQEFSLGEYADEINSQVKDVGIEDVENLNTPKSFTKNEIESGHNNEPLDDNGNLDYWREKFEAEQNIDDFDDEDEIPSDKIPSEEKTDTNIFPIEVNIKTETEKTEKIVHSEKKISIKDILKESSTRIQVVQNVDGHKTYNLV